MKILGISGSLRKNSFNTGILRAAEKLTPSGMKLEIFSLESIPLYNDDVRESGYPAPVQTLRKKIAEADGILLAIPEYNYSYSGVLKNAIDWASRPPEPPFEKKIIAFAGASPGMLGTARAQYHLRQVFIFMNARVLNKPEVFIAGAPTKFDEQGNLTDEGTKAHLQKLLLALKEEIEAHLK